ncbi:2283_t:CDS:2, partial [Acaulospora colombiana]
GGPKLKLLDIDALELARQLTIMESELFFKIKQSECIARSKESTPSGPDNIKTVITLANRMADWVADAVLSKEDPRRRAAVIKHFINVAEYGSPHCWTKLPTYPQIEADVGTSQYA